jgi:hypothetical protein
MTSSSFGLIWYVVQRNRIGLCIVVPLMLVTCAILAALGSSAPLAARVVGVAVAGWGSLYLMGVFANTEGDLVSPGSGYPKSLLILPVSTGNLVFWPMALGSVVAGLCAMVSALCFVPHLEIRSLLGPMAMLPALVACLQAAVWHPYQLTNARGVAVVMAIAVPPLAGGIAWLNDVPLAGVVATYAAVTAVAGVIAYRGVSAARLGDTGGRQWSLPGVKTARQAAQLPPFSSAMRAQVWYEWQRNGRLLPCLVALSCPVFGVLSILTRDSRTPLGFGGISGSPAILVELMTLPLTVLTGASIGCCCHRSETLRRDLTAQPFHATRPITSAEMVGAKLQMAALSALAAGGMLLIYLALWLLQPAEAAGHSAPLGRLLLPYLTPRIALQLTGGFLCLIAAIWAAEISTLWVELTGREWLYNLYSVIFPLGLSSVVVLGVLIYPHPARIEQVKHALPYLVALALLVKVVAGATVYRAVVARALVPFATLRNGALVWLAAACLITALVVSVAPSGMAPLKTVLPVVVLLMPASRLLAAPLALNWNRHR